MEFYDLYESVFEREIKIKYSSNISNAVFSVRFMPFIFYK